MKKKLIFLLLIFTIVLTLTSCDDLLSKIPGIHDYLPGMGTYTVSYSGADVSPEEVKGGYTATRPEDPTKVGYTFVGWYDVDLAVEWNFETDKVTKDTTLYAKWEQNEYDVIFDVENYHQWIKYGNLPKVPNDPIKEGYVFDGWYADKDLTVPFDFKNPITQDTYVYAKWKVKTFTVTFTVYDITGENPVTYRTETVEFGKPVARPEDPADRADADFSWWRDRNGAEWNFDTPVYDDMELVAVFMMNRYTVTFTEGVIESATVNYGETVAAPPEPYKEGYEFDGWYYIIQPVGIEVKWDFTKPVTSDMTLHPKWTPIEFTVTFTVYEGDTPTTYKTEAVEYGKAVARPEDPADRADAKFSFWRNKNGVEWNFETPIYEDMELVGVFEINMYTITYAGTNMKPYDVYHGYELGAPGDPYKDGFTFGGWYADEDLTVEYIFGTAITSNTTIYAKWIDNTDPGDDTLKDIKIFLVGDSTVSSFDDDYYFPRYGWGTQLGNYLTDKATVVNLALSGRSSKSFITEDNYNTLINSIGEGDYLLIAFGHNDEKSDDSTRFTDATKDYTDETSFGWHLYTYYIKMAQERGATPILVTPIVRAKSTNDYSGSEGHVTATGDYRQAIIDLGEAVGVDVIDMTAITKERYVELGYSEALKYHAVLQGKYGADGVTVVENWDTVDKTHLNIYGAKYVSYRIATELAKLEGIKNYVAEGISEPTERDRTPNSAYVVPDYEAPDLDNYSAPSHFATTTDGWYGTAFGNTGGSPQSEGNGFVAKETTDGVFSVGQSAASSKGKFEGASDGFAFLFTQVEKDKNFIISVDAKIVTAVVTKQAGFGLMLRDDCIIDQTATGSIATNYVTAGILATNTNSMGVNFYRENSSLNKGTSFSGFWAVGDTARFTIERIGQTVNVTVEYGGKTYEKSYYDFDFFAKDSEYMYVGMFSNRGTIVEFSNLEFTITGESQGA